MSTTPHIYTVSCKAYQDLKDRQIDQIILVSGESGAGKTEATKFLVEHLIDLSGNDATDLKNQIIQVNPLLENFGNAKTKLNKNSSRFAKLLKLNFNKDLKIHSAKIQDFVLEKSRVVHYEKGESTFHAFYALLAGVTSRQDLYISPGQKFRITGDFSTLTSRHAKTYRAMYEKQQEIFKLIKMRPEEREDVDTILAAILHIGEIEFKEADGDCVTIENEETVQKVAHLLDLDRQKLTEALIERRGKIAGTVTRFSKKRRQANDERDALAKTLYEKLFGWLVRKINDALMPSFAKNAGNIGILDICGFEDLQLNSFEQLCINIINERLQNFMNKKIIEDEKCLYEEEGIDLGQIETSSINNDYILNMFMKNGGVLASIDEDSSLQISDDTKMVRKLDSNFGKGERSPYVPSVSDRPEFTIKHFAGDVKYDGRNFITKNKDILGDLVEECLKQSTSLLVKDLFHVQPSDTGSISMTPFTFQGSRRGPQAPYRPLGGDNLSNTINQNTRKSIRDRFGTDKPSFKADPINKKTHIQYFKNSLQHLKTNMENANPFFVRCIKSNDGQQPGIYDIDRVRKQLRYNGVTEIARIRSCAFPVRMVQRDFIKRYGDLDKGGNIESIIDTISSEPNSYRIGKSQVFMTSQFQSFLEDDLAEMRRKQEEEKKRIEREKAIAEEKRKREEREREKLKKKQQEEAEKMEEEQEAARRLVNSQLKPRKSILKGTTNPSFEMETIGEVATPVPSTAENTWTDATTTDWDDSDADSTRTATTSLGATYYEAKNKKNEDDKSESEEEEELLNGRIWKDHFLKIEEEEEREDLSNQKILKAIKFILIIFLAIFLLLALVVQKVSFITLVMELRDRQPLLEKIAPKEIQDRKTVAYVMLIIVLCIPYVIGFILSVCKLMFSISKSPSLFTWIWVLLIELLHCIGVCILVFRVMPQLDYFKNAYLMSMTILIPATFKLIISDRKEDFSTNVKAGRMSWKVLQGFYFVLDLFAFVMQAVGIYLIFYFNFYNETTTQLEKLQIVAGLVFVSVNQWENFADGTFFGIELNDLAWFKNRILKMRYEMQQSRHFPNAFACLVKLGITILLAYLFAEDISFDYESAFDMLNYHAKSVTSVSAVVAVTVAAFVAFNSALISLKLQMGFSFALPLALATPLTLLVFYLDCREQFLSVVTDLITETDGEQNCRERFIWSTWEEFLVLGAGSFISLLLVTRHIWRKQMDKNSNMDRLYVNPFYCGFLTAENLMLNHRRHQCKVDMGRSAEDNFYAPKLVWYKIDRLTSVKSTSSRGDSHLSNIEANIEEETPKIKHITPKIFACATMWHETKQEMVQILKSLHRMDRDQFFRNFSQKEKVYDPNYYEFEAHILFDDAMELNDENEPVPNKYVKDLIEAMSEACCSVHNKPMKIHDPVKIVTPYGGQLIWSMPGENMIFVHLKDMSKIRNRKRWSQVMYMYYLLDYRMKMFAEESSFRRVEEIIKGQTHEGMDIDQLNTLLGEEHEARSKKTFILALDGDTDFNPQSVSILLQAMDDDNVGAACGRIHPIGKGPMIWYQKFEYAVGHWLQKASEHMFGCVLCSPGCFSLFRAKALMDTNVVRRYTSMPGEASQHLQYDLGEDRWLCTLLLQRGYRIMYAAGADAWTFAPEGFFEFFSQRRRWMPSTIANILDLLSTSTKTREVNPTISLPYILYTWLLMLMTLLGPGTILMMIAGAFQLIFELDLVDAYLWAVIPSVVYIIVCFWVKDRWQLLLAGVLSIVYAFIMMVVLVGTVITASNENIFHPSVIIMVMLLGIFILTGLCHPKEVTCLFHGFLYLICIPSGYLLLVIYSICNLNNVSWGTREVPTKAQKEEMERKKKEKEEAKKNKPKKSLFRKLFDTGETHIAELTNLVKMLVPRSDGAKELLANNTGNINTSNDSTVIDILTRIEDNTRKFQEFFSQQQQGQGGDAASKLKQEIEHQRTVDSGAIPKTTTPLPSTSTETKQESSVSKVTKRSPRDAHIKPEEKQKTKKPDSEIAPWTKDKDLGNGDIFPANEQELIFWNWLIKTYLYPIKPTAKEKEDLSLALKALRNSSAFAFIMVNALWMAMNFMFQYTEAGKIQVSYQFGDNTYEVEESILGLSFIFLLILLLVLQFIGMILHRMETLQQLLLNTRLWERQEDQSITQSTEIDDMVRNLKNIIKMGVFQEIGMETKPPLPSDPKKNNLGLSVRQPDAHDPIDDNFMRSIKVMGDVFEAKRLGNTLIDPRSAKLVEEVTRALQQNPARNDGAISFRPNLPPRNMLRNRHSVHNNWGMTIDDVRRLRPDLPVRESQTQRPDFMGHGALGRSLLHRASVIQEQHAKLTANWTDEDVAKRPAGRYHKKQTWGRKSRFTSGSVNHM